MRFLTMTLVQIYRHFTLRRRFHMLFHWAQLVCRVCRWWNRWIGRISSLFRVQVFVRLLKGLLMGLRHSFLILNLIGKELLKIVFKWERIRCWGWNSMSSWRLNKSLRDWLILIQKHWLVKPHNNSNGLTNNQQRSVSNLPMKYLLGLANYQVRHFKSTSDSTSYLRWKILSQRKSSSWCSLTYTLHCLIFRSMNKFIRILSNFSSVMLMKKT